MPDNGSGVVVASLVDGCSGVDDGSVGEGRPAVGGAPVVAV